MGYSEGYSVCPTKRMLQNQDLNVCDYLPEPDMGLLNPSLELGGRHEVQLLAGRPNKRDKRDKGINKFLNTLSLIIKELYAMELNHLKKIAGITTPTLKEENEEQTEFGAYNIDALIKVLEEIKQVHGNLGLAAPRRNDGFSTEGLSIELRSIHAYNQTATYVCFLRSDS